MTPVNHDYHEQRFFTRRYSPDMALKQLDRQKRIHEIIFKELVRKVVKDISKQYLLESIDELSQNGAQVIVLGCTELPFIT